LSSGAWGLLSGVLDLAEVRVGLSSDPERGTGVTAVVLPPGARGAVAALGGAPATRETDCLRPENLVAGPDAILLCGGSAFGLSAADGAMQALKEAGRGVEVGGLRVPIVPAAAIFDLGYRSPAPPTAADGRAAVLQALGGGAQGLLGSVGAGTGATVGKLLGPAAAMKGGQGVATARAREGVAVGAIAVVNALGSVVGADGRVIAGPRLGGGGLLDSADLLLGGPPTGARPGESTTIAAVLVQGLLDKAQLLRVAYMAHDGLARAISPAHTLFDGDTVFAVALGGPPVDPSQAGALAALALAEAVRAGVRAANELVDS